MLIGPQILIVNGRYKNAYTLKKLTYDYFSMHSLCILLLSGSHYCYGSRKSNFTI